MKLSTCRSTSLKLSQENNPDLTSRDSPSSLHTLHPPLCPNRNTLPMTSKENDVNNDKGVMTKLTATQQQQHSQNHDGFGFVCLFNLHLLYVEHRTCDSLRDLLP